MQTLTNSDLLARVPLFSQLNAIGLESLARNVVKRRYKRGESIVVQGSKSIALYVLIAGRASVVAVDGQGKEVILASLQPGDYLGEMSLIDGAPHSANVMADRQTDVLVLARAELIACMKVETAVGFNLMKGLVQRLRQANQKIESLALMDVYGRVARVLLDMAQQESDSSLVIKEKISKQTIAKMVGASREMVTRVMRDLEQKRSIVLRADGSTQVQHKILSQL